MTGISMRMQLGGGDQAIAWLDQLVDRIVDKAPLMRGIAGYLRDSTRQRFEDQKGPDGKAWKPSIRAQLQGGQTLVNHGILRDSYNDASGEDFAQVGTADKRAGTFQFGRLKAEPIAAHTRLIRQAFGRPLKFAVWQSVKAHERNPNIAARPMLGLSIEDREEIIAMGQDYLAGEAP